MHLTQIFEQVAESFGRPFTLEEITEELLRHEGWRTDDKKESYVKSCIYTRLNEKIRRLPDGRYEWITHHENNNEQVQSVLPATTTISIPHVSKNKLKIYKSIRKYFDDEICNGRLNSRRISNKDDIRSAIFEIYKAGTPFSRAKPNPQTRPSTSIKNEKEKADLDIFFDWLAKEIHNYFTEKQKNTLNVQTEFDDYHEYLCDEFVSRFTTICRKYNKSVPTYGNAQKMINMAFKYLACYEDYDKFADLFSYCHIPIDSIILCCMQRVYDLNNTPKYTCICKKHGIPGTAKIKVSISQDKDGKFSYSASFDNLPWSQLDEPHYLALVEIYRAAMESSESPLPIGSHPWLAFDFHYWRKNPHKVGNSYKYDIIPIPATHPVTPIPQFYM